MSFPSDNPKPQARVPLLRRSLLLVVAVLVVVAGGIVVRMAWSPPSPVVEPPPRGKAPPDPRLSYEGPFSNVHPDVAYVGDSVCTPCHREKADSYPRHPMARSLQPNATVVKDETYDGVHNNPFTALGTRLVIERSGNQLTHRAIFAEVPGEPPLAVDLPVHFAIGSGTHGRSYLSVRTGFVFQTPISWYSSKQSWELSPGFSSARLPGRPVAADCLFCHSGGANVHNGSDFRYEKPIFQHVAIGCERCHGPGARHAQTAAKYDIVHPGTRDENGRFLLTPKLRDAVCEQCHLEGEDRVLRRGRGLFDYRPGLPLEPFWSVFVMVGEQGEERAVSHVEQMHKSQCYQANHRDGRGPLVCVSCHDPHIYVEPADQARYYRGKCQVCHAGDHACSEPKEQRLQRQPDDSCIACHMPRFSAADVVHVASTDHRVRRRPSLKRREQGPSNPNVRLAPFYPPRSQEDRAALQRDLGIALVQSMLHHDGVLGFAQDPVAFLEASLTRDPDDVQAWTMKGMAWKFSGESARALAALERALQLNPEERLALEGASKLERQRGQLEKSVEYARRLVEVYPEWPQPHGHYALVLEKAQRWKEAREQAEVWLRLAPSDVEAHCTRIRCLLRQGNKEEARREFARLAALKPANFAELQALFAKDLR